MARILADLPDDDIEKLDARAAARGTSRAAMLREAVKLYLTQQESGGDWVKRGAGYWKDRTDIGDAVDYQRAMRTERRHGDEI